MQELANMPTDQLRAFYLKACDMKQLGRELYAIAENTALDALAAAGDLVEAAEIELMNRGGFFEWLTELDAAAKQAEAQQGIKQGVKS